MDKSWWLAAKTPKATTSRPTGGSATLLTSGNVLAYGNKFSCYAAQTYSPSTNTWARTIGQCGNDTSYGPLVLLRSGRSFSLETRSRTAVIPPQPLGARCTILPQIPGRPRDRCFRRLGGRRHCFRMAKYYPSAAAMRSYIRLSIVQRVLTKCC